MFDLIIIGAGPAGLSASVYASRYGVKNVVVGEIFGGMTTETHELGNWLGSRSISGAQFALNAEEHARSLGAELLLGKAQKVSQSQDGFTVALFDGKTLEAKSVIFALGTRHKKLDIPGEKELMGKGVSYCATCDGFFYKNKVVGVVGGGNSAVTAALHLAKVAAKVYIIYRRNKLRAENYLQELAEKNEKISIIYDNNVTEIKGGEKLEKVLLAKEWEGKAELALDGLFIEIGLDPNTQLAADMGVALDDDNYIKVDSKQATSLAGVFAAGDATDGSNKFQQIITAAAEGAIAANSVSKYLKS